MRKEKVETKAVRRLGGSFRDMKVHSEDIRDFKVDSEPSFRMEAEPEGGPQNKADRDLAKLIQDNVMPARRNAGLKPQTNRRYK